MVVQPAHKPQIKGTKKPASWSSMAGQEDMRDYIRSIAFTKEVVTNGRIRVSHSQCVITAITRAAVETKNNNQYNAL